MPTMTSCYAKYSQVVYGGLRWLGSTNSRVIQLIRSTSYGPHSYHNIFVWCDKRGTSAPYKPFSNKRKSLFETSLGGLGKPSSR